MPLTKPEMIAAIRRQLAIDLNCDVSDFDKEGIVFCESRENPGRIPLPRGQTYFQMVTMGYATIVSATPDILPFIREQLTTPCVDEQGFLTAKSRDEAFEMPFVIGTAPCFCYFGDKDQLLPVPAGYSFTSVEQQDIPDLYSITGFRNAINYRIDHPRPDVLAMVARHQDMVVGIAGCSADCEMMWQIGIDVLPAHRRQGIAAALTNHLADAVWQRGKVPYYRTSSSNIASQRVAFRAGLAPTWVCAWRGRFNGELTQPSG